jgi:DNA primase
MSDDRTQELLAKLAAGVAELETSEGWQNWLKAQAKFHRYSFGNVLLLMSQNPEATQVAGFHTWKAMGRSVNAGEHGLKILAPCTHKVKAEAEGEEDGYRVTGFRVATVFDVSQTSGAPLEEHPSHRLTGAAPAGVQEALGDFARSAGWTVAFVPADDLGAAAGATKYLSREIVLSVELEPAQAAKTLAHEIGHALLHGPEFKGSREQAEVEAESVAYLVCQQIGLETGGYSFGYVLGWASENGATSTVGVIQERGQRITKASQRIVDALEAPVLEGASV